jgi:hypothetical protein
MIADPEHLSSPQHDCPHRPQGHQMHARGELEGGAGLFAVLSAS